MMRERKQ